MEPLLNFVLLPGLDGTGLLFEEFICALPPFLSAQVVSYPAHRECSAEELLEIVQDALPQSGSYVLLAESFSTWIAVCAAAERPAGLEGLILCAGFVSAPANRAALLLAGRLRLPLPAWAIRFFLCGAGSPLSLVRRVRGVIRSVLPRVIAGRLCLLSQLDVRAEFRSLQIPILYLRADSDRLVSQAHSDEMRILQPDMQTVTVEGPHLLLQRQANRCLFAAVSFCDDVRLRSRTCAPTEPRESLRQVMFEQIPCVPQEKDL